MTPTLYYIGKKIFRDKTIVWKMMKIHFFLSIITPSLWTTFEMLYRLLCGQYMGHGQGLVKGVSSWTKRASSTCITFAANKNAQRNLKKFHVDAIVKLFNRILYENSWMTKNAEDEVTLWRDEDNLGIWYCHCERIASCTWERKTTRNFKIRSFCGK